MGAADHQGREHAVGHRLAMSERRKIAVLRMSHRRETLEGMSCGVAEVEDAAQSLFLGVDVHYALLLHRCPAAGACHPVASGCGIFASQRIVDLDI